MPPNSLPKWTAIKPKLAALQPPELIEVIKSLFDQSPDNRLFLTSKLAPETIGAAVLEPYKKRIVVQFFPSRGFGKLNLKEARQAIRDYRKATSDTAGTLELMMTYVENGTAFTNEYGDIDDAFYNSLMSVLEEIAEILKSPYGRHLYPEFSDRLSDLYSKAADIGWGYGDNVREIVSDLVDAYEESEEELPEKVIHSPLDVPGINLEVSTEEIVNIVRESRERH